MLYLILAVLSSAMVSITMRISTEKVSGNVSLLAVNYLTCAVLSALYAGAGSLFPAVPTLGNALLLGFISGVLYLAGFAIFQVCVIKNGVVLSAIFMKLGLLVPMVVSICFFHEVPGLTQILGFILAVAAIILINFEKGKTAVRFRVGLILVLLAGGGADAMSKVYEELGDLTLSNQYLFYTFLVAALLCVPLCIYKKDRPGRNEILYGMLVGLPNFFSAKFLLRALEFLPAVIVYPCFSVTTILFITLAGVLFFREKLGRRQQVAIVIILAAVALLNL